jgi:hypothetical protein
MSKFVDITGMRSGKLVARRFLGNRMWECDCDCGNTKAVRVDHIVHQDTKTCGCSGVGKLIDVTGQTFGNLFVIGRIPVDGRVMWECKCLLCGNIVKADSENLRHGLANPCECSRKSQRGINSATYKHGGCRTRLYNIWQGMLNRCRNPNIERYDCYGGRGIKVCDEWYEFSPFQQWAIANGYADDLSIDRIDVDGNYEPSNCRWIPMREQAANRRPRRKINVELPVS